MSIPDKHAQNVKQSAISFYIMAEINRLYFRPDTKKTAVLWLLIHSLKIWGIMDLSKQACILKHIILLHT